ncbi:M4 family metallopeptidase [Streptomyces sp. G-G2]|uniref:M4 family metallopeptidase n=1 Tax=Streptomyces sp. G-G2 TaxID=3046201 RepID=UPI0024B9DD8F|nr:M4 family metallopeptidase [Streptomyces sp. G-G2]MDJ0384033.1 M4 family metallopeptidase [Streptomyces sp. G-G2]
MTHPVSSPRTLVRLATATTAVLAATLATLTAPASATPAPLSTAAGERLTVRSSVTDPDGTTHTHYDRAFAGIPVLGGDLIVHQRPDGTRTTTDTTTAAALANAAASPTASSALTNTPAALRPGARQILWAATATPALAWDTVTRTPRPDGTPSELHTVTDARTGAVLGTYDTVHAGVGNSQYAGSVPLGTTLSGSLHQLRDTGRGDQRTLDALNQTTGGVLFTDADDVWGNGGPTSRQTAAVDAHYGTAVTWDFYRAVFNRNGIRGDGRGVVSRVHYGTNYANAFWDDSCGCVSYGDGAPGTGAPFTSLDIVGHELAHGLTATTAGLLSTGEPGALNEGTSDILGTAGEFFADNATDTPDYYIGERVTKTPLRTMDRPSSDGTSRDYWSRDVGSLPADAASGPARHFFYLLSEGSGRKVVNGITYDSPTYDGSKLLGITQDKAVRIWYRALTVYMTSTANYSRARAATLQAATDLYGVASAERAAVAATWNAVNVR